MGARVDRRPGKPRRAVPLGRGEEADEIRPRSQRQDRDRDRWFLATKAGGRTPKVTSDPVTAVWLMKSRI